MTGKGLLEGTQTKHEFCQRLILILFSRSLGRRGDLLWL